jgi:hypothetical protein
MTDEPSTTAWAIRAIQTETEDALFDALLEDWEYGNCPGSKLKAGNQEIWLYTREDVRLWLRAAQRARKEPS